MAEQDAVENVEQNETLETSSVSELEQLRFIVFGQAKNELDARLDKLHQDMQTGFEQIQQDIQQKFSEIQASLEDNVNHLDDRIAVVDSQHEEKSADLNAYTDKLAQEIETFDANAKQQDDELHKRLDSEIQTLSNTFNQQHKQTLALLEQVKVELTSSKTDRKTLAKLLATMATNLETDDND